MFDLQSQDGSVRKTEFRSPIPQVPESGVAIVKPNLLDGEKMMALHSRLLGYYTSELDRQFQNRVERAEDDDYYDNKQWAEEDALVVENRGQKAIVYNVIAASVDWITNTEKRARADFKVLPRRKDDAKPAMRKTELLKYLSDANHTPHHRSRAFEDGVKSGLGWVEDGVDEDSENEPLYSRYVSWREMLHDSRCQQFDIEDSRFLFRSKWIDLDILLAMFRKRQRVLQESARHAETFLGADAYGDDAMDASEQENEYAARTGSDIITGYYRQRVRTIEGWIRIPVDTIRLKGGSFSGEIYDPHSPGHEWSLAEEKGARKVSKTAMRMHVAIFTPVGMLWFSESPYRHNRFPFTPVWGKRRGSDGQPYGLVRGLKGMQDDINKRASKALYILSTNKIIMDEDALPKDMDLEDFRDEAARPDAILLKKKGSSMQFNLETQLSQYQLEMMSRSIQLIQQSSGVTDELLGRKTNAVSGKAIQSRQDQGSMATGHFFSNQRLSTTLQGEKQLANVEQFMTEEKAFRITNQRGVAEFVEVNNGLPENDIVRSKADFVISDADWHATLRQANVEALIDMIGKINNPQITLMTLDLVIESMDLAMRDELVKRIRKMTGQKDPDAADEPPTPEEEAAAAQAQEQQQLQLRGVNAEIAEKEAKAAKLLAEVDTAKAKLASINVGTQQQAMDVGALSLAAPPAAAHVADLVLAEAGYVSESDKQAALAEAAMAEQEQAMQAEQSQMPPPTAPAPAVGIAL